MTNSLKQRIPISITIDPIEMAKYKCRRDYLYHNDPLYRQHVDKQRKEYFDNRYKNKEQYQYKQNLRQQERLKDPNERAIQNERSRECYYKNKENIDYNWRLNNEAKRLKKARDLKSPLGYEHELRELSE